MTQEEKELLLKDLCTRLPYGVVCECSYNKENGSSDRLKICSEGILQLNADVLGLFIEDEINLLPYLRPMSSMTLGEFQGLCSICSHANFIQTNNHDWIVRIGDSDYGMISCVDKSSRFINWLNANHFDYHGLIPMGLALKAPDGMYNTKNE